MIRTDSKIFLLDNELSKSQILCPLQIVTILEPSVMPCELLDENGNPLNNNDWKSWLIEQIEIYANSKQ